jgi:taurine transport system permease protein
MVKKKRKSTTWISVVTGLVILLVWYLATKLGNVSEILFPSPRNVWDSFIEILRNGYKGSSLLTHLGYSLRRILVAYFLAIVTFLPLGLACGYNEKLNAIVGPIIAFFRPLPPLAYYSILVLWLGIGDGSKITLLYLACAPNIFIACVTGVQRINEDYINGARTLGANNGQVFRYVMFFAALPDIFTGLRNALVAAYSSLVAAEMVAALSGIGWMVVDASRYLRSDIIFVGIIIMGIIGIVLDWLLEFLDRKLLFWKNKG